MGSQGGPNKMAAVNFLWLHFLGTRSSIQSFFFVRSMVVTTQILTDLSTSLWLEDNTTWTTPIILSLEDSQDYSKISPELIPGSWNCSVKQWFDLIKTLTMQESIEGKAPCNVKSWEVSPLSALSSWVSKSLLFLNHRWLLKTLRTVPTIVIVHAFCASPDTWISYRRWLLIQGYFCMV